MALRVLLVAALVAFVAVPRAEAKEQERSAALGAHGMVYLDASPVFKAAIMREAAALGATLLRVDVPLALMRPTPGLPDYRAFDEEVDLGRQAGIGLVGILTAAPEWAVLCPLGTPLWAVSACAYANLALYEQHVADVVRRGRGVFRAWEVLNEPEGPSFRGTPEQYAAVLDAAIKGIRRGDPSAEVVIGGTPFDPIGERFVERVLRTPGFDLANRIDVANIHVRGPLVSLDGQIRRWTAFMQSLGVDKPLWVTEFGYPSDVKGQNDRNFGGSPEAARFGGGELGQASFLSQAVPALLHAGAARVFVTMRDGQPGPFHREGLLKGEGVADPPGAVPVVVRKRSFRAVNYLVRTGRLSPPALARGRIRAAAAFAARTAAER
jgi:hypothetical protein